MPPFQDEPEESRPKKSRVATFAPQVVPLRADPVLFGEEPEELPRQKSSGAAPKVAARRAAPVLFGEEPEELPRQKSYSSSKPLVPHVEDQSSSDDEGASGPPALNVGWSALAMFGRAQFMGKVNKTQPPEAKKRAYDNSRRAQRAAESDTRQPRSYKSTALDPSRLATLQKSKRCKCGLLQLL